MFRINFFILVMYMLFNIIFISDELYWIIVYKMLLSLGNIFYDFFIVVKFFSD